RALAWGVEFVIVSPIEDPIHVETLAMVGHYHADPKYRLNVGSTINIGRSWIDGAAGSRFLVSLPYFAGPRLEIYSASVIGRSQRMRRARWGYEYPRTNGQEALEQRLEALPIDAADPNRRSAV